MSKPEISRKQAWMKLAVLIADGLPEPNEIRFHSDDEGITLLLDDDLAMAEWAKRLGIAELNKPLASNDGDRWIHGASTFGWHGWYVRVTATTPRNQPEPEEITEDLTEVRKLAEIDTDPLRPTNDTADDEPDPDEAYRLVDFAGGAS